jgi:hypothetical protein
MFLSSYSRVIPDYDTRSLGRPASSSLFEPSRQISYSTVHSNGSMMSSSQHIQQQSTDRKLEELRQHGIAVQPIVLRSRKSRVFNVYRPESNFHSFDR